MRLVGSGGFRFLLEKTVDARYAKPYAKPGLALAAAADNRRGAVKRSGQRPRRDQGCPQEAYR